MNTPRQRALCWYVASLLVFFLGLIMASRHYPGGFDWLYTVASALASRKHNPAGSVWFSCALSLSMVLLWPYVSALKKGLSLPLPLADKFAVVALQTGLICGFLLGLERLLIHDLSAWIYKAHEFLGVFAFFGLFIGVLTLLIQTMLRQKVYVLSVFLIIAPILAIAITQFWLYLYQRDLGWVDTSWKEMGISFWLSFAFWQWLAMGFLSIGLCLLSFTCIHENKIQSSSFSS